MLAVLGHTWGLCWRSWAGLGTYVGGLGLLLGPMLAVLGRSWGLCGRSGAEKSEEHGYLENVVISRAGARSAASGAVLGRSWTLCWRSWAAPGAYVAGLGPLLGPMFTILGPLFAILVRSWGLCSRSWGLCWRSWAVVGCKGAQTRAGRRSGQGSETVKTLNAPRPPTDFFYRYSLYL